MSLYRRDWGNVGRLAGGQMAATALAFLFLPVLARLFGPATLGMVQSFTAVLGILAALVTLRYELAILVAEPARRQALAGAALRVVAALSLLVFVGGLVLAANPAGLRDALGWPPAMALLLGVATLLAGVALVQQYALMAAGDFATVARARLVQVAVAGGAAVAVGSWYAGWEVLVLAALAGSLLQLAFGGRVLRATWQARPALRDLRAVLAPYRDFPAVNLPANLLNTTAALLPTVIVAARFGPAEAAFLVFGGRLFEALLQPLSSGLGSVYLKGLADDLRDGGRPLRRFAVVAGSTAAAGLLLSLVLLAFADQVVGLLLGAAFLPVVALLPWLAAWRVMQFINQPVSATYTVLGRQRISLLIVVVFFVPRLAAVCVADDFLLAVQAFSLVSVVFYLLYCIVAWWLLVQRVRGARHG